MTDSQLITNLLSISTESETIEFKRLGDEDKIVQKTLRSIVAMTNTYGGIIVLWIDDPEKSKFKDHAKIFGIEENPENYDEIIRLSASIIPSISISPQELFDEISQKTIILLRIPASGDQLRCINGETRIRLKKGNKRLETPQEIIKYSYAKWFTKADHELVDVDWDLLDTSYYESRKKSRNLNETDITKALFQTWLARKDGQGIIKPTRAAVLLFALYPTTIMDTKCTVRVYQYTGNLEHFQEVPNLIWTPQTLDGPIIKCIEDAHKYVLLLLRTWVRMPWSGFVNSYQIPERAIKEAITNAVIHRDYFIKRDIEVCIFEDRIEITSPGLLPYNITPKNIGFVRSDHYRNDLIVKHLREFPSAPNLDRNEWVKAIRNEMKASWLYPPIYLTYPHLSVLDSVRVVLLNESTPTEREKVSQHLQEHTSIDNRTAREILHIHDTVRMSEKFKKRVKLWMLRRVPEDPKVKKVKYILNIINESNTESLFT